MRFSRVEDKFRAWLAASGKERLRAGEQLKKAAEDAERDAIVLGVGDEDLDWLRSMSEGIVDQEPDQLLVRLQELEEAEEDSPYASIESLARTRGEKPRFMREYPADLPEPDLERSKRRVRNVFAELGLELPEEDETNVE